MKGGNLECLSKITKNRIVVGPFLSLDFRCDGGAEISVCVLFGGGGKARNYPKIAKMNLFVLLFIPYSCLLCYWVYQSHSLCLWRSSESFSILFPGQINRNDWGPQRSWEKKITWYWIFWRPNKRGSSWCFGRSEFFFYNLDFQKCSWNGESYADSSNLVWTEHLVAFRILIWVFKTY